MKPLIDCDVLVYECGFGSETGWVGPDPPPFERVRELLENRIANICAQVDATEPPSLYLTGKDNFREKIAVTRPYKGNRQGKKPFHYNNLRVYLTGVLGAIVVDGMEADDAMSIEQTGREDTIICSRDKDLLQVDGWQYQWELGAQPSFGPHKVEGYGFLEKRKSKIFGYGIKFFLSQCLTGDSVDNILGIPRYGPSKAFELLENTKTYEEGLSCVVEAYKGFYGDVWKEALLENGRLLWMTREIDKEGKPVLWELTKEDNAKEV